MTWDGKPGCRHSPESIQKMRESHAKRDTKHREETKGKMKSAKVGERLSKEPIARMSVETGWKKAFNDRQAEILREFYFNSSYSLRSIAKELGIGYTTIYYTIYPERNPHRKKRMKKEAEGNVDVCQ